MQTFSQELDGIEAQQPRMLEFVRNWCAINSGTHHLAGIERCAQAVIRDFAPLGGALQRIPLAAEESIDSSGHVIHRPLAPAVQITKRRPGALRVLLCIHLDTVYGPEDPFQNVTLLDPNTLRGPAVADAKGGIAVMLAALQALERSPLAQQISWEIFLNTDEEIGSVGSILPLRQIAARNDLALLFEPALADGSLIGNRKGSGNFAAIFRGRAAHAGRDPEKGRNAIHAMARFISALNDGVPPGVNINFGAVEGGRALNVVPDLAIGRFNVRVKTAEQQQAVEHRLADLTAQVNGREGYSVTLHGGFTSPPRLVEGRTLALFEHVIDCGRDLGMNLRWVHSGGVSDGNKLAAAGLPNVDNLGPIGQYVHSDREEMTISSLTERAKLTALLLFRLAAGEIQWPIGKE